MMPTPPTFTPVTPRQTALVAGLALLVVLVTLLTMPYADLQLPVVTPFLPMFAATVTLTEGLTAYLLVVQFVVTRQLFLMPLAAAYAFTAAIALVQVLAFPGVFAPAGLLGGNAQSAVWLWVFWHGGFALLVCVSIGLHNLGLRTLEQPRPGLLGVAHTVSARTGWWVFAAAPVLLLLAVGLALWAELPPLISGNSFKTLAHSPVGWTVWGVNLLAALLLCLPRSRREVANLFLFIAVLAALADVSLTLLSSARYSLGWYTARLLSIVSSVSLLVALIYQLIQLYHALAQSHQSLQQVAARDHLTGLFNRHSFDAHASTEWLRAQRSGEPLSVVLVDIDHFKRYNDHFGHLQGDTCLRRVAEALAGSVKRPADMVARYGGEEFVLVLPNTAHIQALQLAEGARQAVASLQLAAPVAGAHVAISAGCATWDASSGHAHFKALLQQADEALYQAKARGRNQVASAGWN